jgi:adenosylcobinamide kinase/adenosylcobinamide-phosphate guanylyltransferase
VTGNNILVGGGSRSGKSSLALRLARGWPGRRLFLATAQAGDQEMTERIRRHRETRGDEFRTVEEPFALPEALRDQADAEIVIVDCVTLWLANLLLAGQEPDAILVRVEDLLSVLRSRLRTVILVTNEVGMGIVPDNALARAFRDLQGTANQRLALQADEVYLTIFGMALRLKPALTVVAGQ